MRGYMLFKDPGVDLAPSDVVQEILMRALLACALMIAVVGVPLYASVHESIESLVAFGTGYDGW